MDAKSERPKGRDIVISTLNMTIDALDLAKDISGIDPAKAAFGSVSALLTMIRVRFPPPHPAIDDELPIHVHYSGFNDQRTGLHRARLILR